MLHQVFDDSANRRTYIVAEMSANHGQQFDRAIRLVHAMKEAGADAVKLQTYTADTLTIDCDNEHFRVASGTLWEGRRLHDLYREAATPWQWHEPLFELASQLGMDCFSTPFDRSSVDFLQAFNPPAYKIASFEIVDLPLIEYVASRGRPLIVSTGMATLHEIRDVVEVVRQAGVPLALLKCTSAYPSPPEAMNLLTIPDMARRFDVPVGLSDHTLGIESAVAAVALGARVIEKHFTLSRDAPGPDSAFSLEPDEFKAMVDAVRVTEKSLGQINYELTQQEQASQAFRRSLFAVADIDAGETFTEQNVRSIRPGGGLPPKCQPHLMGRHAKMAITRGTPLRWDHIDQ